MGAAPARQQTFRYRALDATGGRHDGQLQAGDEAQAWRHLLDRGLTPVEVSPLGARGGSGAPGWRAATVTLAQQQVFVQELATLLAAGISLSEAVPSLASAYAGQPGGASLQNVDRDLRGGQRLSAALQHSGLNLPPYVLALVEAGEASGDLAAALHDAAQQMDHERRTNQELRNALVYPAVLVASGVVAVLVIFIGVVPRFASLLKSSRAEVPALSRWIIESGLFVKQHLLAFGLGAAAVVGLAAFALAHPGLRAALFDGASRLPLVGPWLVRVDLGRWTAVLGTLLGNRVPIIQAITLSLNALRLARLRQDLSGTARELERGKSLSDVLSQFAWFPRARVSLLRVGERSGELPRMLSTMGAMETEAARTLQKRVLTLIEPLAILLIGAVIGVIMIAVMMAITSLNTSAV